jgi:hypothetical protein
MVSGFKSEATAEIWAAKRAAKSKDQWERQPRSSKE